MSKKSPILVELALGLFLTALVAWSYHKKTAFLETVSFKTYDGFYKFLKPIPHSDAIRIVEIDDASVAALGRWPWPRSMVAQLLDQVVDSGAKVMGLNILLVDPDQNEGMEKISALHEKMSEILDKHRSDFKRKKANLKDFENFLDNDLAAALMELDSDSVLTQSIEQATNIVLPMYFLPGDVLGNNLTPLPADFQKEALTFNAGDASFPKVLPGKEAVLPLEEFSKGALAVGHCNLTPDMDGSLRRISPLVRYGEAYYPSFGLQMVREYLQLQRNSILWKPGAGLTVGKANIPLDSEGRLFLKTAGPAGTFPRVSAVDVLSGALPEKALNNKIVLIGLATTGQGETFTGPGGERFTGLEIWSNHIENILSQKFISRPDWGGKVEWAMLALAALVLMTVLPMLRARFSMPISLLVLVAMLGASFHLFVNQGLWVSPAYGAFLLISGFVLITGKRLVFTEKRKELVEAESLETNKMLGLSFQGQGMLDIAFEKFRRCPIDDSMKDVLYNLGLDMERKRQFAKAAAVYEHIATADSKYKDISEKIDLLKKAGEGAVFGGIGKKGSDSTVVVEGLGQYTTLGRYEVQKELGRGAMGIVYLGKDPKINRQVAIKTLRFEDTVDEEQTKSIKERFFREAESAGNLTHPNIIRIFDAGEDQDVAYIAMELLEGHDLKKYTDKANLLTLDKVVDMVIHVAQGLDYAHKQGVVHRDIKPGNIMLLKDGSLRITDFGIARIQATSKTATGAVLGTPAYMSPEQVNGKKVDGRADIFSLGVTLFEMLTGEKPFVADSIAALLYRIANVEHTDPREYNRSIPSDLVNIINKALAKDPAHRFQAAGDMAKELSDFLNRWKQNPSSTNKGPVAAAKPLTAAPAPVPAPTPDMLLEKGSSLEAESTAEKIPTAPPVEKTPVPAAPLSAPDAVVSPPAAPAPLSDQNFLSELEEAFKLTQAEEKKEEKTVEKKPEEKKIDTVILPEPDAIEKTVLIEPKGKIENPPVSNEIEHNFQPPIPGTQSEPKKGNAKYL